MATATVLTAVAGARRGESALGRLRAVTLPSDAVVLPNDPKFDWDKVRAMPGVAAVSGFAVAPFSVEELPGYGGLLPPADHEAYQTVERPVVLEGRLADPGRADEVMVTGRFPAATGLGVGDALTLRLMTEQEADDPYFDGSPHGPRVRARIVGVIRSFWFSDTLERQFSVYPSPALFAAYPRNFVGTGSYGFVNALVRLDSGEEGLPTFKEGLAKITGRTDIEIRNEADVARHTQQVNAYESLSLLAFALAALVAAVVLVGQSVARYTTANVTELQVLRVPGMTTRQTLTAAAAGPFLASLVGATLGIGVAVVGSLWMPIGAASLVEPVPGIDVDVLVLASGWAVVPLMVLAGALVSGRISVAAARSEAPPRRSAVARAGARLGLPVPLVVGSQFALEPGRGRDAVPVRPAMFGAVAGVLGVLSSFTFAAGVTDAANDPRRFGQTFQLLTVLGENGRDWQPTDKITATAARDRDVIAVNDARIAVAGAGQVTGGDAVTVTVYTYAPVGAPVPVVLTSGRLPETAGDIVLGPITARNLELQVGSTVRLTGTTGPKDLKVSGIGFVPQGSHNDYHSGAWTSAAGFETLFGTDFKYHAALVALRGGADTEAVRSRLLTAIKAIDGVERMDLLPMSAPPQLVEVQDIQSLPLFLGGFLALLAVGAVGHALATAVRRRRRQVAVMRTLGMTRRQSRLVVFTQASLLAIVGLSLGVPLGVMLGRTLWRIVANQTPLFYEPPVALWALLAIGPAALLVANLLALWPGHLAARLHIGHIFHTE
ncbi:ABC transporter permease [Acrocarpospora catenulata]|uniref:ABC transporter permease n=1 Tax=Acrocarpospora catenulata TaxID=2836182 RepID=UPI001BDA2A85|nr:ABC transporter permease [Acrocarpospora catenulata]